MAILLGGGQCEELLFEWIRDGSNGVGADDFLKGRSTGDFRALEDDLIGRANGADGAFDVRNRQVAEFFHLARGDRKPEILQ